MRALKRRVADLEQQLAQQQAASEVAAQQAQAGTAAEAGRAARAAAALQQCEQQLAEARQQCEEYGRRLAAVEGQLQKAEFARAQWEWRAQVRLGVGGLVARQGGCYGMWRDGGVGCTACRPCAPATAQVHALPAMVAGCGAARRCSQ